MNFNQWMSKVNQLLEQSIGLSSMDLVDQSWRNMFDDGMSPTEATSDIINDPWSHI